MLHQARSQDFLKGCYVDVCVCMHVQACSSRKCLEIRCSEIASEATLGQKQSRSSYVARGVDLYWIQFLAVHVCIC